MWGGYGRGGGVLCGVTGAVGGVASVSGTTLIEIFLSTNKARQTLCNFKYFLTLSPGQMWCLWRLSASKQKFVCPSTPIPSFSSYPPPTPSHKQLWAQRQSCCCRNARNGTNGKWEMVMEICLALGQSSLPLLLRLLCHVFHTLSSPPPAPSHLSSRLLAVPSVRAKGQMLPAAKWSTVTVFPLLTDWWQTALMCV